MLSPHSGPGPELFLTEIKVADWSRSVRWYVEILGLRMVLSDAEHAYALLAAGPSRLALKGDAGQAPGREAARLVFQVDDAEAQRERLIGLGVDVGPTLESDRESYREVRLADPDGTPISLFSWTDSRS